MGYRYIYIHKYYKINALIHSNMHMVKYKNNNEYVTTVTKMALLIIIWKEA